MESQIYELLISYVGGGVYLNAALAANYTVSLDMDGMSPHFYQITPTGADREFILPAPSAELVGLPFLVSSTAAAGGYNILVKGKTILIASPFTLSAASTIGTIAPGATAYAICRSDGTYYRWAYQSLTPGEALTLTGALTAVGITNNSTLDQNGNIDHDTTQAASGAGLDTLAQVSSATGSPDAVVVGLTQITNNRSSGTATGVDITMTGRAGDGAGGTYEGIRATAVASGGSAVYTLLKVPAGWSRLIDLTDVATGEADIVGKDNLADFFGVKVGSDYYIKAVSTTGARVVQFPQSIGANVISEVTGAAGVTVDGVLLKDGGIVCADAAVLEVDTINEATSAAGVTADGVLLKDGGVTSVGAITTTDGVAAGVARKVGGTASVAVASTTLGPTGGTAENTVGTYTIPANTFKAGTLARVRAALRCTAETGATTLTMRMKLGGTTLFTSAAIDLAAGDVFVFDLDIVSRAAPSASSALVVAGTMTGIGAAADVSKAIALAAANYATDGALALILTAQLSASDANAVSCDMYNVELVG